MSYELDLWGQNIASGRASRPANDLAASRYFRETIRITVAADVANGILPACARRRRAPPDIRRRNAQDAFGPRSACSATGSTRASLGEYDLRQAEAELEAVIADIERGAPGNRAHRRRASRR